MPSRRPSIRSILIKAGLSEEQIRTTIEQLALSIGLNAVFKEGSNPTIYITLQEGNMTKSKIDQSDRSVRNVTGGGNVVQTGDHNTARASRQKISYPQPEHVNIVSELAMIRNLLENLETPEKGKIANALGDVDDEISRESPDKDEVGGALERALKYAKRATNFTGRIDQLKSHVVKVAGWLGEEWHNLIDVFS